MTPLILAAVLAAAHGWPDTPQGRAEAMAAIQGLNVELLTHDSATATLESWCATHRLAESPWWSPAASRTRTSPPAPRCGPRWASGPIEPVRYRRVDLACGDKVLSQADNRYSPARLTPQMNAALDSADTLRPRCRRAGFQAANAPVGSADRSAFAARLGDGAA